MATERQTGGRWLQSLAAVPWLLAMLLVLFVVIVGGVISIVSSRFGASEYFRDVAIVTAALLLAIGGFNGRSIGH